jgi:hypothetical protein
LEATRRDATEGALPVVRTKTNTQQEDGTSPSLNPADATTEGTSFSEFVNGMDFDDSAVVSEDGKRIYDGKGVHGLAETKRRVAERSTGEEQSGGRA